LTIEGCVETISL